MAGTIEILGNSGERLILHYADEAKGGIIGVYVEWVVGHTVRLPYQWHLERKHFVTFQGQVQKIKKTAVGSACLSPEDKRFYVILEGIQGGHFKVEGNFEYDHTSSYGITSSYALNGRVQFETDQSMLEPTIVGLADMLRAMV